METYRLLDLNSRDSSGPRQSAARPPSFARFAGRRSFPPIQIARQIRPARRAYYALPMAFFDCPIADQAIALASQYAETVFDPRPQFAGSDDWLRRCGGILRQCDAIFVLMTPDLELSSGAYSEAAYAHALGLPVHVISWRLRGKPKLEFGGEIVPLWDWTWWRAAQYRPPKRADRAAHALSNAITSAKTSAADACAFLRFTRPKEKAPDRQSTGGQGA